MASTAHSRRSHQAPRRRLRGVVIMAVLLAFTPFIRQGHAQPCPAQPVKSCQSTAPQGALLHTPNTHGVPVWTTACGPNTFPQTLDRICDEISRCQAAGGFGKFLDAVTGQCRSKHFAGYFGLDGMTFGILDWTEDNLPTLLRAYRRQSPASFDATLGALGLPMQGECLDAKWACENNRQGRLMCVQEFSAAFRQAIGTAEFQQAQVSVALDDYEHRLKRFAGLGLQTEYGNIAMLTVANNLVKSDACTPAAWKAACAGRPDEKAVVDCMLDRYVEHACRGSPEGSARRRDDIKRTFAGASGSGIVHPTREAVIACAASWGQ